MNERILLSTYAIKVLDNNRIEKPLSIFNGQADFLNIYNDFAQDIFINIERHQNDPNNRIIQHLTLSKPPVINQEERCIYGYFSSGVSGDRFDIRDIDTNETELVVDPNRHASFRNVFFYLYIPQLSKIGYLILQRKSKFGVKTIVKKMLNKYVRENGYSEFFIEINNLLHNRVYEIMLANGSLKKIDLIKRRIPDSIDEYYNNNRNTYNTKGTLTTTIASSSTLSEQWKDFIDRLFRNRGENTRIELSDGNEELDEIEFELELNGKKKKFHIINKQRTQPDIDVTSNLDFENGEPTISSLISESQSLINDMLQVRI